VKYVKKLIMVRFMMPLNPFLTTRGRVKEVTSQRSRADRDRRQIRACGEYCVLATKAVEGDAWVLILCNAIGAPVDSKCLPYPPPPSFNGSNSDQMQDRKRPRGCRRRGGLCTMPRRAAGAVCQRVTILPAANRAARPETCLVSTGGKGERAAQVRDRLSVSDTLTHTSPGT
jgi:hypothetical protein